MKKKLTESDKSRIKEYFTKRYNLKEGFIEWLFGKALVNRLSNDAEFVKKAKELDRKMAASKEGMDWFLTPKDKRGPLPPSVLKAVRTGKY